jgi:dTMP kinase
MTQLRFYGDPPPGIADQSLPGRLVVVEGTDGVGRSTQIALLKEWLEASGYAVLNTGLRRSSLAGRGIERAKLGHTLDPITLNLFYATDFCDRMEHVIIPGLRAGMVVLTDRYVFSIIARAVVRGVNQRWIEDVFGFALVPDIIFYLDIDVDHLLPRVLSSSGFDYWESGQDFLRGHDVYKNFIRYQSRLLPQFQRLAEKHDFKVIDARRGVLDIFGDLQSGIRDVVAGMMDDQPPVTNHDDSEPLSATEIMSQNAP